MIISTFFSRIFAAFLTLFVFMSSGSAPAIKKDASAVMTAVVVSDIHMEGNNTGRFKTEGKAFEGIAAFAPDALITTGDNTMNGQSIEWNFLYGFLQRTGILKNSEVIIAQGNHDFGNTSDADTYNKLSERAIKKYSTFTGNKIDKVYYSTVVNGIKVIALGSEMNMEDTVSYISDEQLDWLEGELASEQGRPVIIANHNLIYGTNYPQSNWYFNQTENYQRLQSIMENHDGTVLYFCGHSHYGLNSSTVVTQKNVTYINIPLFTDGAYSPANEDGDDAGIGCVVSVYEGKINLSFRNFITGKTCNGFESIDIAY